MIDRDEFSEDELAGRVIDYLRERDDVTHVQRFDNENKEVKIIVEPNRLDDSTTFIPSEILEEVAKAGFVSTFARFNTDGKYSPEARVMGFARYRD